MSELVLALHWDELRKQEATPEGVCGFDLSEVDQMAYALIPRHIADNKSPAFIEQSVTLGKIFPQILGYFQITNPDGRILAYQRKGKEKGLLGKWSIGVGGHVSQEDFLDVSSNLSEDYPDLNEIIYTGSVRELEEELGIDTRWIDALSSTEDFVEAISSVLYTWDDSTSAMHVGLPLQILLPDHLYSSIKLDPAEFLNFQWLLPSELNDGREWETWSKYLIQDMK